MNLLFHIPRGDRESTWGGREGEVGRERGRGGEYYFGIMSVALVKKNRPRLYGGTSKERKKRHCVSSRNIVLPMASLSLL